MGMWLKRPVSARMGDGSSPLLGTSAQVWDVETGKPVGDPMPHTAMVMKASFSADGRRIVTACADRTARMWDAETGKPIGDPMRHQDQVRAATFSPDGRLDRHRILGPDRTSVGCSRAGNLSAIDRRLGGKVNAAGSARTGGGSSSCSVTGPRECGMLQWIWGPAAAGMVTGVSRGCRRAEIQ